MTIDYRLLSNKNAKDNALILTLPAFFEAVFTASEGKDEGQLIGGLVSGLLETTATNDLLISVAIDLNATSTATSTSTASNVIKGCVLFSRLVFTAATADKPGKAINMMLLAPMAVATTAQKQGIGQRLIQFSIQQMKQQGVDCLMTYGDVNFYGKVGFEPVDATLIKPPHSLAYPQSWLGQSLSPQPVTAFVGKTTCVRVLNNALYW
ncbi:GNAT family N-acetyltransferase [Ostreibacterium oceani]|uniref:GNAT family N-acetyltransferase n=1 Tax=Ostreibacterium oceani TaxID=2654998 RepID=A0A6N7EUW9_9GAMM|nr:GNAT family N-acetyltransferase [Ostreibacterium oceani]MPV85229.1 GNAT family N-acetyltransferase [Ostreibacterium oceani]